MCVECGFLFGNKNYIILKEDITTADKDGIMAATTTTRHVEQLDPNN